MRNRNATEIKDLLALTEALRQFADERDWGKFHSPKNLAIALAVEAAEILEHFQWLKDDESRRLTPGKLEQVREELADVLIYLTRLADELQVDLLAAAADKLAANRAKYPAEKVHGKALKYNEYEP